MSPVNPQSPVQPGDVIASKYRVERVLGIGGMGVVLAAWHLELEQRVAIKLMLPNVAQQPEYTARFLREGKAAVRLKSEHVARVFDVGRLAIGLYLARSTTASSFGAAGSVVALLLWMYYSALIVFFGAEFTRVHLRRSGLQTQAGAPPVAAPDEQRRLAA